MGLVTHQMQIMSLIQRKYDQQKVVQDCLDEKNYYLNLAQEARQRLKGMSEQGMAVDSDAYRAARYDMEYYNELEKQADLELQDKKAAVQATEQEINSCTQELGKDIQGSFSYSLGGGQ